MPKETLGLLYQAATEPEQWPAALAAVAKDAGGTFANLFMMDKRSGQPPVSLLGGDYARETAEPYVQYYHKIDPRMILARRMPEGVLYACHHHFDDELVAHDETYQDMLIPHDIRYTAACTLMDNDQTHAVLGVLRSPRQGPFEEASLTLLRELAPHIKRAGQIHQKLMAVPSLKEGMASLLDLLDWPVVFTDVGRRIILCNHLAEQLLARDGALCVVGGRVTSRSADEAHALEVLVAEAGGGGGGRAGKFGGGLAIRRGDGRKPLLITIVPMAAEAPWRLGPDRPAVVLFITDPERRTAPPVQRLAQMFGLTRAEARLASVLAAGQSLDAIADERGLSKNTLKTQLRALFAKTETDRQTELIRLLNRLPTGPSPHL